MLDNAAPGQIVRVVGNIGKDGSASTIADNFAYEIGTDLLGNALPDGADLNVPKGVSLVIDAGAIFQTASRERQCRQFLRKASTSAVGHCRY